MVQQVGNRSQQVKEPHKPDYMPNQPHPLTEVVGAHILRRIGLDEISRSERTRIMGEMLQQGMRFPKFTLNLTNGETLTLPDEAPSRYTALIFYRGHW